MGELRFRILGPLEVRDDDGVVAVRPGKPAALLALLLLRANHVVPAQDLIESLWGCDAPATARQRLHVHLSGLRHTLKPAAEAVIQTRGGGYLVRATPDTLDLLRFQDLITRSGAASDPAAARTHLVEALGLWHRPILPDLPVARAPDLDALDEQWVQAVERRVDLDLQLGRHGELINELNALVTEFPFREHLWARLITALYRAGRQADALAAYDTIRRQLADELGLEPGEELQRTHRAILTADPDLAGPMIVRPTLASWPAPAQLPADPATFTGRTAELAELDTLATSTGDGPAAVVITAIAGTAGVGKTALAVHWAHRARDRYADGQLYVNLRGYHPDQPVAPGDALNRFLRALGVPGDQIPAEIDDRAARYRTELTNRRLLVVLDNARGADQVRPLLPGSRTCLVLITSRDTLPGLVALDGARRLDLDLLPPADAVALLSRLIGPRAGAEPQAVATLAEQCARLPLALRIAAELANARPTVSLTELAADLADHQRRLDLLTIADDPPAAVHAVFFWSYQRLDPGAARTFRLLGLHPGPDIDPFAAAALVGTTTEQAREHLTVLARAHLAHATAPGRYAMHDLLRAYATHRAATDDPAPDRHAALTRLLDHYLHTAAAAVDLLYPHDAAHRPHTPAPTTRVPDTAERAAAWLTAEHANLLATAAHATEHGWPAHTIALSAILSRHLRTGALYTAAHTLHTHALTAARRTGDPAAEHAALRQLGYTCYMQDRYEPAADYYQRALAIAHDTGDHAGELDAYRGLGAVYRLQGRYEPAVDCLTRSVTLARDTGDRNGELTALGGLGDIHRLQGRYGPATDCYQRVLTIARDTGNHNGQVAALGALADIHRLHGGYDSAADCYQQVLTLARDTGNRPGEIMAWWGLGDVHRLCGRYEPAARCYQRSLTLARDVGNRNGELLALSGLGDVDRLRGSHGSAADRYQQALTIARDTGNRNGQLEALHGLAQNDLATGRYGPALSHDQAALALAVTLDQRHDQARAHNTLALTHDALGDTADARDHWRQAHDILTALGLTRVDDTYLDDIRARLTEVEVRSTRR